MFDDYICYQIFNVNRLIKLNNNYSILHFTKVSFCVVTPKVKNSTPSSCNQLFKRSVMKSLQIWFIPSFCGCPKLLYTKYTTDTNFHVTTKATLRNLCVFQNNSGLRDVTFVNCGLVYSKRMIIIICHNTQWSV